jgi:hypothetical protein
MRKDHVAKIPTANKANSNGRVIAFYHKDQVLWNNSASAGRGLATASGGSFVNGINNGVDMPHQGRSTHRWDPV